MSSSQPTAAAHASGPRWLRTSPLSYRNFRWLWTGSVFSYIGQWIQQATLGWVVYEITGSGALLGAILGMRAIPMIFLAPLAGVAADRYDRRILLLTSQLLSALTALALGAALALHWLQVWHLFMFTLLMGACNALDRPARHSTVFELVPRTLAMKAVALNTIGFSMTRIIGPAIAGYLVAWFGAPGNFLVQGSLYLVSCGLVFLVVFPARKPRLTANSAFRDLGEGVKYLFTDKTTRTILTLGLFPCLLMVPMWGTLFPILAKDVFHTGPEGLGILLTGVGVGGTIGGFIANALARHDHQGRVQFAAIAALCLALLGIAFVPAFWMLVLCAALGGGAEMVHTASNLSSLQMSAPEEMRGRVSSFIQLYPAFISIGSLLLGPMSDWIGPRNTAWVLALVAGSIALGLFIGSPRARHLRLSHLRGAQEGLGHR